MPCALFARSGSAYMAAACGGVAAGRLFLPRYGQKIALQSRASALRQYTAIFPDAFSRYAGVLGEGMPCAGHCSQAELAELYSQERFLVVYSVLRARHWVPRSAPTATV